MSDLWLKWHSQLELLNSLDQLLESESFVDVTIAVEGQLLRAHRVVLCASSCYFNSILRSNATIHPIIFMRDVKFAEMKAILDFIYKGEAFVTQENIQGLLKTAEALKITGLSSISWTESSMNYMQVDEASQCDITNSQTTQKPTDDIQCETEQKNTLDTQKMIPIFNDNSASNSSGCQESTEEGGEETKEKVSDADIGTSSEEASKQPQDSSSATTVAHVSASVDGENLMILEAPPNISIFSVPVSSTRPKSVGRQYTKDDLKHALDMVRQGQMGIKPAARAFNIPVATLHHAARRNKISSPMQQGGNRLSSNHSKMKTSASVVKRPDWSSGSSSHF